LKLASGLHPTGAKDQPLGMPTSMLRSGLYEKQVSPTAVQDLQSAAGACSLSRDKHYGNDSSGTYAGASSAPAPAGAETDHWGERGQALASMTTKAPQAATRTAAPQALSLFIGDAVACLGSTG